MNGKNAEFWARQEFLGLLVVWRLQHWVENKGLRFFFILEDSNIVFFFFQMLRNTSLFYYFFSHPLNRQKFIDFIGFCFYEC